MIKQSVYCYLSLLALLSLGGSAWAADSRTVDETRPAQAAGDVRISNLAGQVTVQGWERNEVHVSGELATDVERLEFNSDANGVEIRVILREGRHNNVDETRLEVQLPRDSRLSIDTVSADINVQKVTGVQRLHSISGNILLNSEAADISIETISGNITLQGSAQDARIEVSNISGDMQLSALRGELDASSVSGDTAVSASNLARADFSNTSGDIEFTGALQAGGTYGFNSVSGDTRLRFPTLPDATFDISTFSGEIDNEFGPEPRKISDYSPGKELRFTQGEGLAQVSSNSLSGEIALQIADK